MEDSEVVIIYPEDWLIHAEFFCSQVSQEYGVALQVAATLREWNLETTEFRYV
jgi:hypothetical protein